MPSPQPDSYSAASGAAVYAGTPAPAGTPAWLASQPQDQWFNAPNSLVTAVAPSTVMNDYGGTILVDNTLYAFAGGHGGSTDNSVARYDLSAGAGWELFVAPTPAGQRVSAATGTPVTREQAWWGDAGDLKPNPPHTYSYGKHIPELNRIVWFCHRGIHHYSGNIGSENRLLQLNLATGKWVQPDSAEDVLMSRDTFSTVRLADGRVIHCGAGTSVYEYDPSKPQASRFSTWTTNGALNWSGYGQLLLDSAHGRLIRIGNGYGTVGLNNLLSIDLTTKAVTDLRPLVTGDSTHLSGFDLIAAGDTLGACLDPINNRIVVPLRTAGGSFYSINLDTLAMTLVSPAVVAGSTVAAAPGSSGYFGRVHYHPTLKALLFNPDGTAPLCVMRLG